MKVASNPIRIESKPAPFHHEFSDAESDKCRGLVKVAQRLVISGKTSAVVPSDSDAVHSLIRQARSCTDTVPDNLYQRGSSKSTTCENLKSLGVDNEEIKVAPKLAQLVQDRWQATLSYNELTEKYQHYLPLENAALKLPLTKPERWSRMLNQLRTSDLSFSNIQRNVQKATIAISQVADQILQTNDQLDVKSVLHTSFDAVALLGHTINKLSVLRRTNIKPALSEEYRGLCKLEFPVSDYLFGQDLAKIMAQAKEMNTISKTVFKKLSNCYQQRFQVKQKHDKKRSDSFCGKISDIRMSQQ